MANILKKLVTKIPKIDELNETVPIQTSPLSDDHVTIVNQRQPHGHPVQLCVGSGQSTGMQRDHNEDTLFSMSSVFADGKNDLAMGIFIVADGMGGHKNGEVASGSAARVAAGVLVKKVYSHFLDAPQSPLNESLQEIMEKAIEEAHKSVLKNAPGGGTTLTCALIIGEQVTIGHIGDSRAYFIFSDGRLQQITKDHSLVQRMVELEEISEAQAQSHPQRNVLLKAIGQTENVFPDIQTHPLPKNGSILMCSDGLWGVVPESKILTIIKKKENPEITCRHLVEAANENGGPDNISAILIHCIG